MNAGPDLFPWPPAKPDVRTPAARATDPDTSHAAAEAVTKSGVRAHQQRQVLAALREWPGCTSAELARHAHMDRYAVARRLPELVPLFAFRGVSRNCHVSGRPAVTWWALNVNPGTLGVAA